MDMGEIVINDDFTNTYNFFFSFYYFISDNVNRDEKDLMDYYRIEKK